MKNIKITKINTKACPGTNIDDCIYDCLELSFEKNTPVNLTHGDTKYIIDTYEIMQEIAESGK